MRTVTYRKNGEARLGILVDGNIYDAVEAATKAGLAGDFSSLKKVLEKEGQLEDMKALSKNLPAGLSYIPFEGAELEAPIMDPQKVLGAALNYRDFCVRGNLPVPEKLKVFSKFATAVNKPNGEIDIRGNRVTYEGELAVIIGKKGRAIKSEDAMAYVAGYTAVNDCTANNLVKEDVQLFRAKNLDGFLPMGPVFVTADEIPDYKKVHIQTKVDGEVRQDACVDQIIFDIPYQIQLFSEILSLEPGDVIATGTPAGTALQFDPPRFLQPGQKVSVTLDQIGTLENTIVSTK